MAACADINTLSLLPACVCVCVCSDCMCRKRGVFITQLLQAIVIAVLIGTVFLQVCDNTMV
jgi:hypothetical protein